MKFLFRQSMPSQNFIKWFLIIGGIACFGIFASRFFYSTAIVVIAGEQFNARVADTAQKRIKGLSGSEPLQKNEAMLFVFYEKSRETFWMKDVSYPIDIVWFTDGVVVDIAPRVPPPTSENENELRRYTGRLPVDRVIELPAGTADRLGLKIGDKIVVQ
jgi:uncharacterized protein